MKNKDELIAILKKDKDDLEAKLEEEKGKRENENQTSTQEIEQLFLKMVNISEEKNSKPWWQRIFKK